MTQVCSIATRKRYTIGHSCGRDPRTGSFSGGLLGSMST